MRFGRRFNFVAFVALGSVFQATLVFADTLTWIGGTGSWSEPANWDAGVVPPVLADVVIDDDPLTNSSVTLSSASSINSLIIDADDHFLIDTNGRLAIFGGLIVNDGDITISNSGSPRVSAELLLAANAFLEGTGTLTIGGSSGSAIASSNATQSRTLGISADQTIAVLPESSLQNAIEVSLTNFGSILADGSIRVASPVIQNVGEVRSRGTGSEVLLFRSEIENTGGTLAAESGSTIVLDGAFIANGELVGSGTFAVRGPEVMLQSAAETLRIDSDSTIAVTGPGRRLGLLGDIQLDGTLVVANQEIEDSTIRAYDNAVLTGSGTVRLEGPGTVGVNTPTWWSPNQTLPLIIDSDILVTTDNATLGDRAVIGHRVRNFGTIEANVGELGFRWAEFENRGVVRAVNGGTIRFDRIEFDNNVGTILTESDGIVVFESATLNGGTLDGSGFQCVMTSGLSPTLDGSDDHPVALMTDTKLACVNSDLEIRGTIVNDGEIRIRSDVGKSVEVIIGPTRPLDLQGSGVMRLEGPGEIQVKQPFSTASALTLGKGQTIIANHETTIDSCRVQGAFDSAGTIRVDGGGMHVGPNSGTPKGNLQNQGVVEVVNSGSCLVNSIDIDNTNGVIHVQSGSNMTFSRVSIASGTITGGGVFDISRTPALGSLTLSGIPSAPLCIDKSVTLFVDEDGSLGFSGQIVNDGKIAIGRIQKGGGIAPRVSCANGTVIDGFGVIEFGGAKGFRHFGSPTTARPEVRIGECQSIMVVPGTEGPTLFSGMALTLDGSMIVENSIVQFSQLSLTNNATIQFSNSSVLTVVSVDFVDNTNGTILILDGSKINAQVDTEILGGEIVGDGRIDFFGSLVDASPLFPLVTTKPGNEIGALTYSSIEPALADSHTFETELGGYAAMTEHDVVVVEGVAQLDGALRVVPANGFAPAYGDRFTVLTAASVEGRFNALEAVGFADPSLTIRADYSNPTRVDVVFVRVGDLNCDGAVTVSDIGPFVTALIDPAGYAGQYPGCEILSADLNADGAVTVSDIGDFVSLLTGG